MEGRVEKKYSAEMEIHRQVLLFLDNSTRCCLRLVHCAPRHSQFLSATASAWRKRYILGLAVLTDSDSTCFFYSATAGRTLRCVCACPRRPAAFPCSTAATLWSRNVTNVLPYPWPWQIINTQKKII